MINVCLIGYGAWGKKVFYSLKKIKKINKIYLIKNRREKADFKLGNIDDINNQFELTIFSNNLSKYRSFLKEGNLLIFEIDVIRNIQDQRFIIKNIQFFSKIFHQSNKSLNIYITPDNLIKYKNSLFVDDTNPDQNIYIYLNIDHKLINLDFKKKYSINSFKYLDELSNAKKLDYSIEIT